MNADQAKEAAAQIGLAPGEEISLQSQYQIENSHAHKDGGAQHHDGFAVRNNGGILEALKLHTDDNEKTKSWWE